MGLPHATALLSAEECLSALDQVADLAGICTGAPADLASNPEHLADFGER